MPRKTTLRRSPYEGGAYQYMTKAGPRWYWKAPIRQPDGSMKIKVKRGFLVKTTPRAGSPVGAMDDMRAALEAARKGEYAEPSKMTAGAWLDQWLGGLRLAPSTVASYRKNARLHLKPYIGDVPLASLTPARLAKLYHDLETGGRRNGKGELTGAGLSARTVRYVHTIINAALASAVKNRLLIINPATDQELSKPPSAQQAEAPEMHPWTADQLRAFLGWSRENSPLHPAWQTLAHTGMRRGELLALRWRDIDLDAGTISIQRSVGVVRNKGEGAQIVEKTTKTKRSRRVIDIDPGTITVLRAWRKERRTLNLVLARDDALVFGDQEGQHRHPERFWRAFKTAQRQCAKALGDAAPPVIAIHDLRHTHATLLLSAGEPVKVVSERLGHASVAITLMVYGHVMPGDQKRAADRFAALVGVA